MCVYVCIWELLNSHKGDKLTSWNIHSAFIVSNSTMAREIFFISLLIFIFIFPQFYFFFIIRTLRDYLLENHLSNIFHRSYIHAININVIIVDKTPIESLMCVTLIILFAQYNFFFQFKFTLPTTSNNIMCCVRT